MSAKVISIINYKGGVGKTVSTYNIAFGLSFLNDHKVLIVDLDPQCSLSTICLNALGYKDNVTIDLSQIREGNTINSVIKDYLSAGLYNPNIDLNSLLFKQFYKRENGQIHDNVHFIPATMYDNKHSMYEKGLDDLEIDIIRNYSTKISPIELITIFARFFKDTKVDELYDFILFDCPPANNVITQNALVVSDYYLIPTIMDSISTNGINHLINLIDKTIFDDIYMSNKGIIDRSHDSSPYSYLKKKPKLLGIFETLRKAQIKNNNRHIIEERFQELVFDEIIYHHKPMADISGIGRSCFSENINQQRPEFSPHVNYGQLTLSILRRLGIPKVNNGINEYSWL